MTYEELKIQLDINDPIGVLEAIGKPYANGKWIVICDEGDCHLLDSNGNECDIREVTEINVNNIHDSIKKVVIPDSVVSIKSHAFAYCSNLASVTILDSVTSIREFTFYKCSSLESVTIGNGVKSIEEGAFSYCSRLAHVMIGNGVTSIGDYAFYECHMLTSIMIPDSVTDIGFMAFMNCSSLTSVMIPNSVTSIGYYVFNGCNNLKDIIFEGKTLEEIRAMSGYPWNIKDKSAIRCKKLTHA